MRVYVTGASGFIGSHLVRELRERGAEVRDDFVDLLDAPAIERAVDGCDAVFHLAALYSYDAREADTMRRVNVEGTRVVLEACARRGVRRVVHTSSAGTCGPVAGRVATEEDGPPAWELAVPYKRTKWESERVALAAARDGLDLVVVNPTTPVGEGDWLPTPTGRMVDRVARRGARFYLSRTGLNLVDVRDVARGQALALERGRRGERYLLGGEDVTLKDVFGQIAAIAGRAQPRLPIPYPAAAVAARLGAAEPDEVRLARLPMYFSHEKAARELGYAPGPVGPALERAVAYHLSR